MATPIQQGDLAVQYPFQDRSRPMEDRIAHLVSLLTLEEKVACLATSCSVPRLGVPPAFFVEGLHGLAQSGPAEWQPTGDDRCPTTTFPQAYGLGHTWDPALIQKIAAAQALECRYIYHRSDQTRGGLVVLAPNADLGRDPRWGRTEECFSEDAFLVGELTVAFVRGLQGDNPSHWSCASLMKHFLANSYEDGRLDTSSDLSERLLHEYYAVGFRRGVLEGGSRAYMACYNSVNGVPGCVHPLHRELSLNKWGQDGVICTDGGALSLLISHHKWLPSTVEGSAACIKAGMNVFLDKYVEPVTEALERGLVNESDLDEAITRTFRVMGRLGLLDPAPHNSPFDLGEDPPWESKDHRRLAKEATDASIVLLKNDGLLPLNPARLKRVLVVGRWADQVLYDWYCGVPPYAVSPLAGITAEFETVTWCDGTDPAKAQRLATEHDVVVMVCGNHPTGNGPWEQVERASDGKESVDRQSIDLEDEVLVKALVAVHPKTVMVLQSSFPYAINWSRENVPAILFITHCSQETGRSLADALVGKTNPGGKLTQTWPKELSHLPPITDYDITKGRTYMYSPHEPLFPFGFGLSYTTFSLEQPTVTHSDDGAVVSCVVRNTGSVAGDEVVQVYARYPNSQVARPTQELKAFKRVHVPAGESVSVELKVRNQDMAYWNSDLQDFEVEPVEVELAVGTSSEAIACVLSYTPA